MTNADLLRKLALAATPGGEWEVLTVDVSEGVFHFVVGPGGDHGAHACDVGPDEDDLVRARFIAAANPARVLSLLDALAAKDAETERLEAGHRNLERALANTVEIGVAKDAEIERLRAALQPFADVAFDAVTCEPFTPEDDEESVETYILAKHFRRAAAALSPPAPASAGEPGSANDRLITPKLADAPAPACSTCGGKGTVRRYLGARDCEDCARDLPCPSCRPEGGKS